jgi:uncharacterized protein (TIGR04255 family)
LAHEERRIWVDNEGPPLPDFGRPPVVEVALGIEHQPLPGFRAAHLGLYWQRIQDRFPLVEDHPPLPPNRERFETPTAGPMIQFEIVSEQPPPRGWFMSEDKTQLIQLQHDRFLHNWRKVDEWDEYPRYHHLRSTFAQEYTAYLDFLKRHGLQEPVPTQCEITYVNHVTGGKAWHHHGDLSRVIAPWSGRYSDDFLGPAEDVRLVQRHVITVDERPVGRMHVALDPVFGVDDGLPAFLLRLTARGIPLTSGIDGALAFFDLGRDWIVRGFASMTTPEMHRLWERRNGTDN